MVQTIQVHSFSYQFHSNRRTLSPSQAEIAAQEYVQQVVTLGIYLRKVDLTPFRAQDQ